MADVKKDEDVTVVDNSVPYPEAPPVDPNNPRQEHYRGVREPEMSKQVRPSRGPGYQRPFGE